MRLPAELFLKGSHDLFNGSAYVAELLRREVLGWGVADLDNLAGSEVDVHAPAGSLYVRVCWE